MGNGNRGCKHIMRFVADVFFQMVFFFFWWAYLEGVRKHLFLPLIQNCPKFSCIKFFWWVPNPPVANRGVAERAPWRSTKYRFLSFPMHLRPLSKPSTHSQVFRQISKLLENYSPTFRQHEMLSLPRFGHLRQGKWLLENRPRLRERSWISPLRPPQPSWAFLNSLSKIPENGTLHKVFLQDIPGSG